MRKGMNDECTATKRTRALLNKYWEKGEYKDQQGWFGYKVFRRSRESGYGLIYRMPQHWKIRGGVKLTMGKGEYLDMDISRDCSFGIHCGTKKFAWERVDTWSDVIYKVFLPKSNIRNILVPDGRNVEKLRTDYMYLVRLVTRKELA